MAPGGQRRGDRQADNGSGAGLRIGSRTLMDGYRRRQPFTKASLTVDILTRHPQDRRRVGAAGEVIQSIEIAASRRDANVAARSEGRVEHNPSHQGWAGHGPLAWEAAARNRQFGKPTSFALHKRDERRIRPAPGQCRNTRDLLIHTCTRTGAISQLAHDGAGHIDQLVAERVAHTTAGYRDIAADTATGASHDRIFDTHQILGRGIDLISRSTGLGKVSAGSCKHPRIACLVDGHTDTRSNRSQRAGRPPSVQELIQNFGGRLNTGRA